MVSYQILSGYGLVCLFLLCFGCAHSRLNAHTEPRITQLPDKTIVILNKGAELEYQLTDESRKLQLSGEAYFIVEQSAAPFEVHTKSSIVKALGTSFSVHEFEGELNVEVEEGQVAVDTPKENVVLKTGERLIYNDAHKVLMKMKAEFKHHVWTKRFKNELRKFGKEFKTGSRQVEKELKTLGRDWKIKL